MVAGAGGVVVAVVDVVEVVDGGAVAGAEMLVDGGGELEVGAAVVVAADVVLDVGLGAVVDATVVDVEVTTDGAAVVVGPSAVDESSEQPAITTATSATRRSRRISER